MRKHVPGETWGGLATPYMCSVLEIKEMRLDKFLADMGYGTRKEAKGLLRRGAVTVNGCKVEDPGIHVRPEGDVVAVDGREVSYVRHRYYMLNKPAGVVSATEDSREKTVLELLPEKERKGLFPVGRLDKDTTGLLLLTDDGELAHRLLSPKKHVDKTYMVTLDGPVSDREVEMFAEGLPVDRDFTAMPAELLPLPDNKASVTIHEGKYHQIKRMFEAVGRKVLRLRRISMGSLVLDETLAEGTYRRLDEEEEKRLREG